jgi:hypothetical protein
MMVKIGQDRQDFSGVTGLRIAQDDKAKRGVLMNADERDCRKLCSRMCITRVYIIPTDSQ